MSDQHETPRIEVLDKSHAVKSMDVQSVKVKVRPIDQNAPGFLPLYRGLLSAQRAFTTPQKATPEDVDEAEALIMSHIVEPSTPAEKKAFMNMLTGEDIGKLFEAIMGSSSIPPAKGAG
jgi:hypothetical protein